MTTNLEDLQDVANFVLAGRIEIRVLTLERPLPLGVRLSNLFGYRQLNPVANLDDVFGFACAAGKHKPWFVPPQKRSAPV